VSHVLQGRFFPVRNPIMLNGVIRRPPSQRTIGTLIVIGQSNPRRKWGEFFAFLAPEDDPSIRDSLPEILEVVDYVLVPIA